MTRLSVLVVGLVCGVACGNREREPTHEPAIAGASGSGASTTPETTSDTPRAPRSPAALLAAIPANTPFLFMTLDPIDAALWTRLRGELVTVQKAALPVDPIARVRQLAIAELAKNSLGIDASSRIALYGVGTVPVVRIELADPGATERALERIATAAGPAMARQGAAPTWLVEGAQLLLVAIAGDQLVVAIGEPTKLRTQLATLLAPAGTPLDEAMLRTFAKDRGLATSGLGWIDIPLIATLAKSPGTIPALDKLSARCKAIVIAALGDLPRITLGATELTGKRMAFAASFELDAASAGALQKASKSAPSLPAKLPGAPLIAASLIVPSGALRSKWTTQAEQLAAHCDADGDSTTIALPPPWNTFQAGALAIYDGRWTGLLPEEIDGFVGALAPDPGAVLSALAKRAPKLASNPPRDGGPFVPLELEPFDLGLARRGKLLVVAMGSKSQQRTGDLAVRGAAPLFRVFVDLGQIRARLRPDPKAPRTDDEVFRADPESDAGNDSVLTRLFATLDVVVEVGAKDVRMQLAGELAPPLAPAPRAPQTADPRIAIRDRCVEILRKSFATTAPALAKLGVTTDLEELEKTYTTSIEATAMVRSCAKLSDAARTCLLASASPIADAPKCAPASNYRASALELPPLFSFFGPRPLEARLHPPIDGAAVRAKLVGTWVRKDSFETDTWVVDSAGKLTKTRVDNDTKQVETERFRIVVKVAGTLEFHEDDGHSTESFFMPSPDRFHDNGTATPITSEDRFIAPLDGGFVIREPTRCWAVTREGVLLEAQCKAAVVEGHRTLEVTYSPPCAPRSGSSCTQTESYRFFPGWVVESSMLEHEPFIKR